ncbi:odorant receptor 134-1 [Aplochiton taeniatus]
MNFSAAGSNTSSVVFARDTFSMAVTKNVIVVALCISINYINGSLVHTFSKHQVFYLNPRYILFIHLVVNDMIQLTLAVLLHVLSYAFYVINVSLCCLMLMIAIFTTLNTPINLASMAIERYIAVCLPLRHVQICTIRRTYVLIGVIWALGAAPVVPDLLVILATEPLEFFHTRVFCSRDIVFRNPYLLEKKSVSHVVYLTLVWLTLIFTYFKIVFAAKAASSDARKARNTILLHGIQLAMCMFTFVGPLIDSLLRSMVPSFASYLIIQILPRFVSPIVYGLRDQTFRKYLKKYWVCKGNESMVEPQNNPPFSAMTKVCYRSMNQSGGPGYNMTMPLQILRDTYTTAFIKNLIVVLVWLTLSYINGTVIVTFFRHQVFYDDPRYILFIHMVINDAVQLTVTITLFVLSYVLYRINVSFCCFFILVAVFTTRNTPVSLASMAIERYIAVCLPLRHAQICTVRRTLALIGIIWLISVAPDITDLFVTLATESLSFFYQSVFCVRENVFKDVALAYKRQVFDALYFSSVFLTLVYTYLRVLFAAQALSTEKTSAQRARNTILLHGVQLLMCMLSYVSPSVELPLRLIFPTRILEIRYANYLIVYILPRFLSPIIYGIRDKKFRKYLRRYFFIDRCNGQSGRVRDLNEDEN